MITYALNLVIYFFIDLILVLSVNLQLGLLGIANLGFMLFMGLGGYLGALLSMGPNSSVALQHYFFGATLPFPLPMIGGILLGMLVGLGVGYLVLTNMRGHYLAIMTLAVFMIGYTFLQGVVPIVNGENGLYNIPQPLSAIAGAGHFSYQWEFAVLAGLLAILSFWFCQRVIHSPFGRAAKAVRENESGAEALGKNPFRIRLIVMVAAAGLTALAGVLMAQYVTAWSPPAWSLTEIFPAMAALIVGGRGNNWGAALGTFVIYILVGQGIGFIPIMANNPNAEYAIQWTIFGALVVAFLWFRPAGLIPERKARWPERTSHRQATSPPMSHVEEATHG
ncbi:branched-chain amino acid ABC transporter permease [Sulfobacillus harzensis]|uniref:Branched-chain amino acid ABC transporter permease n=1 Tax=Sulfobacillus harzensis TaxID=2729629 RepID=A0A7Y0Q3D3_9FIRM|nr:branched-chain amino acid ABC transporter permease [Sulfobacillus harzensis]NMP24123.1 branched-chain amino acid ABC transporter permease [Sulfobacillus harzensis]